MRQDEAVLPFEAVLFDMDGTLVDTEPLWQQAEERIMARFGVAWSEADQAHCLGGSTDRVARYMISLIEQAGRSAPSPEQLADLFLDTMLQRLIAEPPQLQPGVARLLHEVHETGKPTALVSSSSRPLMNAVLAAIGSHWFDLTISADDVTRHKPDPLPYLTAADLLHVDPRWSLALEDSPTGAASANAAGAFVLAVEHMAVIEAAPRRVVVGTLSGIGVTELAEMFVPPAVGATPEVPGGPVPGPSTG